MIRKINENTNLPLIVGNLADILMKYDLTPNKYFSMAYITELITTNKIPKNYYTITLENNDKLLNYINTLPNCVFKSTLLEFVNDYKYLLLLGKSNGLYPNNMYLTTTPKTGKIKFKELPKQIGLDFGNAQIFKIDFITAKWKDKESNAKSYKDDSEKLQNLRRKYGFSDGFEDYVKINTSKLSDEDIENIPNYIKNYNQDDTITTWRDNPKYQGHNIMPRLNSRNNGNVYTVRTILDDIYMSNDNNGKLSFRIHIKKNTRIQSLYFLITDVITTDEKGVSTTSTEIFELNNKFILFLLSAFSKSKLDKEEYIPTDPDEIAYIKELNDIINNKTNNNDTINNYLWDNILYFRSKGLSKNKDEVSFIWINTPKILEIYPDLDYEMLEKITREHIRGTKNVNIKDINADITPYISGKSIYDLIDKENPMNTDPKLVRNRLGLKESLLYNKIMNKVKKTLRDTLLNI